MGPCVQSLSLNCMPLGGWAFGLMQPLIRTCTNAKKIKIIQIFAMRTINGRLLPFSLGEKVRNEAIENLNQGEEVPLSALRGRL